MRSSSPLVKQFESKRPTTFPTLSGTSTYRQSSRTLPRDSRMLSVDLDGTVADISKRVEFALQFGPHGSAQFYEALLDGSQYHLDVPIEAARKYLCKYSAEVKGDIVYLSGRRQGTESASRIWLEKHGFPEGQIIHRRIGNRSLDFKSYWLRQFRSTKWVDGHCGDRLEDDGAAARLSGIRFVHIVDHKWPEFNPSSFSRFTSQHSR